MRALIRMVAVALIALGVVAVSPHEAGAVPVNCATFRVQASNTDFVGISNIALKAGDVINYTISRGHPPADVVNFAVDSMVVTTINVPAVGSLSSTYTIPTTSSTHSLQWIAPMTETFNLTATCTPLSPCQGGDVPTGYRVVNGTGGSDTLFSLSGNTVFFGNGGNDHVYAGSGNDFICTGVGNDVISAGAGNDTIYSEGGTDQVDGGSGTDTLTNPDCNTTRISIEHFICN